MADVEKIIQAAQQSGVRVVEQQWTKEDTGKVYLLSCSGQGGTEPAWRFSGGGLTGVTLLWEHATGDISLIHSLVASEWGESLEELISSKQTFVGANRSEMATGAMPKAESEPHLEPQKPVPTEPAASVGAVMLQGDLVMVQLPSLLQSIQMSNMTGRLTIRDEYSGASMFFDNGTITHAELGAIVGDTAVIQLLSWTSGKFEFHPGERTAERTVRNRLDTLLMQGMTFADQSAALKQKKLELSSYLIRTNPSITDSQLEEVLKKAAPLDMKSQKDFYWLIDDVMTLMELLRGYPLQEIEWVPIVFNLVTTELVTISDLPARTKQSIQSAHKTIDAVMVQSGIKGCLRPETGILTYPAFLYFVQNELSRLDSGGHSFSLIVFNACLNQGNKFFAMPELGLKEMFNRIRSVSRPFEMIGHVETLDYGLLLPQTELKTAALVAQRLIYTIKSQQLFSGQTDAGNLQISMGVAGAPEDGEAIGDLVGAAVAAKKLAFDSKMPIVVFNKTTA
jgi:hypothetical protein